MFPSTSKWAFLYATKRIENVQNAHKDSLMETQIESRSPPVPVRLLEITCTHRQFLVNLAAMKNIQSVYLRATACFQSSLTRYFANITTNTQ